jgi:hypothetical protein
MADCTDALSAEIFFSHAPANTPIWINPHIGQSRGTKDGSSVRHRLQFYLTARTIGEFLRLHPGGTTPHGDVLTADFVQGIRRGDILILPPSAAAIPRAAPLFREPSNLHAPPPQDDYQDPDDPRGDRRSPHYPRANDSPRQHRYPSPSRSPRDDYDSEAPQSGFRSDEEEDTRSRRSDVQHPSGSPRLRSVLRQVPPQDRGPRRDVRRDLRDDLPGPPLRPVPVRQHRRGERDPLSDRSQRKKKG